MIRVPFLGNVKYKNSVEPVQVDDNNHGMRSSSAKVLQAGSVLLKEQPFLCWPRNSFNIERLTAQLLLAVREVERTSPGSGWDRIGTLFPRHLDQVPRGRIEQISDEDVDKIISRMLKMEDQNSLYISIRENLKLNNAEPVASEMQPPRQPQPTREEVLLCYFRLEFNLNSKSVLYKDSNSFPSGLMLFLSLVNHSCDPNCKVEEYYPDDVDGPEFPDYQLVAIKDINPNDDISISYLDVEREILISAERRRQLEERYLFRCTCMQCGTWTDSKIDDMGTSPLCEDYLCISQLVASLTSGAELCGGRVDPLSGKCSKCSSVLSPKQLDKLEDKALKLIKRTRVVVERIYQTVSQLQEILGLEVSYDTEEVGGGQVRFMKRKDSCIEELKRWMPELEGLKDRLKGLLYYGMPCEADTHRHVVFRPIENCLRVVREALDNNVRKKE